MLILLSGCSLPEPDEVVHACLDELEHKNYTKMLAYAGPDIIFVYSNNLWLSRAHQINVKEHEIIVEPADRLTSTTAHVRTHITFHQKRGAASRSYFLRVDLTLRDKWYIDDIWHLEEDGRLDKNAIQDIPDYSYWY
jgi:hypothetical protein